MKDVMKKDNEDNALITKQTPVSSFQSALITRLAGGKGGQYKRFTLAALGSIPWVGGVISAIAALGAEKEQSRINDIQRLWLQEHEHKLNKLGLALQYIVNRFDSFGDSINARLESDEYINLVRQAFSSWDSAATEEKRRMFQRVITNAGVISLCSDDVIRLFMSWINSYHEAHFAVIKAIYENPGISRGAIWDMIRGERPREDSPEADLFRYLMSELTLGRVIRQERERTWDGEFVKKSTKGTRRSSSGSSTMKSSFDDSDGYELTELGKQFVHYVMDDVAPQIEAAGHQTENQEGGVGE